MTAKAFKPAEIRECTDFRPAPGQPEDYRGRRWCETCRRWGNPTDPTDRGHPPPPTTAVPPPAPRGRRAQLLADAAELEARRLGETDR
jgi:hypothetical protein